MLTDQQIERYSRQIILPPVGGRGQQRLLASGAAVIGAAGCGWAVSTYLAAAGVGTLEIVDAEPISATEVPQAAPYSTADNGHRVDALAIALPALNPDCRVVPSRCVVTPGVAAYLAARHDVLIDTSGNWETGAALDLACREQQKPLVWGCVSGWAGQVTVLAAASPCFRCLYPHAVALPSEAPIPLVAGFVGTIQATETIKLLLGMDATLIGRLAAYELRTMDIHDKAIGKRPQCAVCGDMSVTWDTSEPAKAWPR